MTTITIERELLEQALAALTYQGTMGPTRRQRRMAAVDALLAALSAPATAPERKPMTPEQIETMWPSPEGTNSIHALVRAVEAFHGIKETP